MKRVDIVTNNFILKPCKANNYMRNNYCGCDSEFDCGLKVLILRKICNKSHNGFKVKSDEGRTREFRCRLKPKGNDKLKLITKEQQKY